MTKGIGALLLHRKMGICLIAALLAALLLAPCAPAEETDTETILRDARLVKSLVADKPNTQGSLNMVSPFAPMEMTVSEFHQQDSQFLLELGIDASCLPDMTTRSVRTAADGDGRDITVVFKDSYASHAFVFEKRDDGKTVLLDCVFTSSPGNEAVRLVELAYSRYLCLPLYGHGTGTMRDWTAWYNLDTRQVDLYTTNMGYESANAVFAETVTRTNTDAASGMSGADRLITYTYTTVYALDNEAQPPRRVVLDDDCTVRIYRPADGGLLPVGERVFDSYAPAVIEQMSEDELLDPDWQLLREGEELLQTDSAQDMREPDYTAMIADLAKTLPRARVVNASWVNLRQEGSKQSPAIATVTDEQTVYVISEGNGFEHGWTHVLIFAEDERPVTGYIWWSFLESVR